LKDTGENAAGDERRKRPCCVHTSCAKARGRSFQEKKSVGGRKEEGGRSAQEHAGKGGAVTGILS